MDLKDIKAIVDLMRKNSIAEFELEREGFKIRLKRGTNGAAPAPASDDSPSANVIVAPNVATLPPIPLPPPAPPQVPASQDIKSPMIGTFYRAPSPESDPYIDVGSEVGPETVVCIIEAMKVMNEIKSEVRGVITQVLIDNSKPVEFGQAIFKVRPI